MWLMKTLLTSGCTNQRGAGQHMGVHLGYVLFGLMDIPPMKLNARQVDTAKPKDEPYKLSDGGGLYLLIIGGLSTVL